MMGHLTHCFFKIEICTPLNWKKSFVALRPSIAVQKQHDKMIQHFQNITVSLRIIVLFKKTVNTYFKGLWKSSQMINTCFRILNYFCHSSLIKWPNSYVRTYIHYFKRAILKINWPLDTIDVCTYTIFCFALEYTSQNVFSLPTWCFLSWFALNQK
jgi:hypothetical protein